MIKQLHQWPREVYYTAALLKESPEILAHNLKISFCRVCDDLGPMDVAIIDIDGTSYVLRRYTCSLRPGTEVLVDVNSNSKAEQVDQFMREFQLTEECLIPPEGDGA